MKLQDKLDAMREDFEKGHFPLYTRRPDPSELPPVLDRLRAGTPA